MSTTKTNAPGRSGSFAAMPFFMTVGNRQCVVRVTPVCPISDVLEFDDEFDGIDAIDARMVADLLDSRIITPPRPRRRRERSVSSRAVFFSAGS